MNKPAIVFAGTPDFALASLRALVNSGHMPVAVYTQPDRPAGRGKRLTASPVKEYALEQGLPVYQPKTLRDEQAAVEFEKLRPDLFVVAAYGLLLPQRILDVPTVGCVNVHASILPRWRGAAPIQASILAGDEQTGISLMAMTAGLDEGPVYVSRSINIRDDDTSGSLHDRLAVLGGELLADNVDAILGGRLDAVGQDESLATYAGKIKTEDARLDWNRPASDLARQVRAYNPVPGSFFRMGEQRIKVWQASVVANIDDDAGRVVRVENDGITVACGEDALRLEVLQRPGKGKVNARQFSDSIDLNGVTLDHERE